MINMSACIATCPTHPKAGKGNRMTLATPQATTARIHRPPSLPSGNPHHTLNILNLALSTGHPA